MHPGISEYYTYVNVFARLLCSRLKCTTYNSFTVPIHLWQGNTERKIYVYCHVKFYSGLASRICCICKRARNRFLQRNGPRIPFCILNLARAHFYIQKRIWGRYLLYLCQQRPISHIHHTISTLHIYLFSWAHIEYFCNESELVQLFISYFTIVLWNMSMGRRQNIIIFFQCWHQLISCKTFPITKIKLNFFEKA